ncbi:MAG TPA: HAMP domain-containing sensor histidine kinase [Myxococcales bacterium]|nr:HAMP domain-containing sensor histidine kinase [Myxococcales bacterium]
MPPRRVSVPLIVAGFVVGLLLASLDHILPQALIQEGPGKWVVIFVDWVAPPTAGVLLAGALLYAQRALRLHEAERAAAQVLAERLAGTERRQAIWVVAAAVAHDVKNPLHNLALLIEDLGEETDPAAREALMKRIRENVSRASGRIAELSRAGRQWQDSVDQKVDLAATLDLLRERLAPTVQATKATLQIDCPKGLAIRGDAHAVRSAVENVAANALEALQTGGTGGRLALRARQQDGTVELIVQDDGPGIPEAVHQALFAPFASGHGSTGLGLAIARALARAGGGDLVCTDAAPGRTTFRFTFQAA